MPHTPLSGWGAPGLAGMQLPAPKGGAKSQVCPISAVCSMGRPDWLMDGQVSTQNDPQFLVFHRNYGETETVLLLGFGKL